MSLLGENTFPTDRVFVTLGKTSYGPRYVVSYSNKHGHVARSAFTLRHVSEIIGEVLKLEIKLGPTRYRGPKLNVEK
jgi:hypothetical protein